VRQITIAIIKDAGSGDYLLQLVQMAGNAPSTQPWDVLAAANFADAQVPSGESTLKASFSTTKIAAGFPYAVVLTRFGNFDLQTRDVPSAPCPGTVFLSLGGGQFNEAGISSTRLVFSVLVS